MKNFKEYLTDIKAFVFDVDGVLSTSVMSFTPQGEGMRTGHIKDGYALQLAAKLGYKIAIISGARTESIRIRLNSLGIQDVYLHSSTKMGNYQDFKAKYNLSDDDILYMGDDIPDIPVMLKVAVPTCPIDAAVEVKAISKYISQAAGGHGCVRDVIEQVLKAQGKWNTDQSFEW